MCLNMNLKKQWKKRAWFLSFKAIQGKAVKVSSVQMDKVL